MKISAMSGIAKTVLGICLFYLSSTVAAQDAPNSKYVEISPSFVTNYDEGARLKYLKARVALEVTPESEERIWHHLPSIQNALVLLFSAQAEENLTSTVGRESLRREALMEVQQAMRTLEKDGDKQIKDLYFTDFVVQQ
ncbi:MAG: flagellar basal body-associated FliL family protein [Pseudohongiellaceae bacterium]